MTCLINCKSLTIWAPQSVSKQASGVELKATTLKIYAWSNIHHRLYIKTDLNVALITWQVQI